LNDKTGTARRYHWHSATVRDFVEEPHTGIVGDSQGVIMNLVDAHAFPAQEAMLSIAREHPDRVIHEIRHLAMPAHHDVRSEDIDLKRLGAVLATAYERDLHNFAELLLLEKLGPRTLQSMALVAEVIHGTPSRFQDPARFSFAHGGKDGYPFPVPLRTYDEAIGILRGSLEAARLGDGEKLDGLRRLDRFVKAVESQRDPEAHFNQALAHEHQISPGLDGRTVAVRGRPRQGSLFD
jgi:hypothetical protein